MSIEYRKGQGINFSELARESMGENFPETLSGQEVADTVERVFDKISPDIARGLVESNVVLTMAGHKPSTDFWIHISDPAETERLKKEIEKLNNLLNNPNILFTAGKPSRKASDNRLVNLIHVDNLIGWERVSKKTKIPGVIPFDRNSGWKGLNDWLATVTEGVAQAKEQGLIPKDYEIVDGLTHGYPDQAIYDFEDWYLTGRTKNIQDSNIPFTRTYQEAEPNYDFYPEHADDPAIRNNIEEAGQILQGFYQSDWHKRVAPGLKFDK